jgi:hypothetical protein
MSQYNKGEFTIVPSKSARKGLKPALQVVYMWLCDHSNDKMESYPSRSVLAEECGMSIDTLDDTIKKLITLGMISKDPRYINNEHTSNLYKVNIIEKVAEETGEVVGKLPPRSGKTPTQNSTHITQPITIAKAIVGTDKKTRGNPDSIEVVETFMSITGLRLSDMTKQRQYASRLLKRESKEAVLQSIQVVAATMDDTYAPRISDIVKLYYKWADLQLYARKKFRPKVSKSVVDLGTL